MRAAPSPSRTASRQDPGRRGLQYDRKQEQQRRHRAELCNEAPRTEILCGRGTPRTKRYEATGNRQQRCAESKRETHAALVADAIEMEIVGQHLVMHGPCDRAGDEAAPCRETR